jgi:hypothetical protein
MMSMRVRPAEFALTGLTAKQRATYRFSILLIDDMPRIGLEEIYRITMHRWKENDMTRFANTAFAALAAFALSIASIGAIVTVPPAEAASPATFAMPQLA